MNPAVSAWTIDVQANAIANCFRHCKIRPAENMASENLDEPLDDRGIQELQNVIKELRYHNGMNVEDLLNYPEENEVSEILTDEQIIENVMGNDQDDEVEDDSFAIEPVSRKEAFKAVMTLNKFLLQYENTTSELLTMLRKVGDEIQGEINFKKKQTTIQSYFKS
ncbi:hypothetical protein PTKIN_Ptkin05aG0105900 [Pterospermum kingtungense]